MIYALEQHGNKNKFLEQDTIMNKLRNENWTALNPELLELLNIETLTNESKGVIINYE